MRINYQRLVHYIYHHNLSIIVTSTLISLVLGYAASHLRIQSDFADLLPEDYISVRELNRIKERVGGIGPLMVIISGDDLDKCVGFMLTLADTLEHNPLISAVSRGKNQAFFDRNRLLYMDMEDLESIHTRLDDHIELQKLKRSPLYFALDEQEDEDLYFSDLEEKYSGRLGTGLERDYYLTREKNGVILRVYPAGVITDMKFNRNLLASLDSTIAALDPHRLDPSLRHAFKGSFKNSAHQYEVVLHDLKSSMIYAVLGVLVLISLYFRQVFAPIFIALPLVMSLSWTFGLTYLVIGNLNQITVGLFAILFGLGIDFGIHIFARYREARRRGMETERALSETVCQTGSALTTTAVTTSVAFYSLLVTDFKGFSEFGFIVGTGILFSLVAMLVICPAFIHLAERLHLIRLQQETVPEHLLRRGRYPMPRFTLALGVLATTYSLFNLTDLEFEWDFTALRPALPDEKVSMPEDLKETRSPAIVLTESYEEAQEVVAAVKKIKAANGAASTIQSVRSVYSALPRQQAEKLQTIARIRALLDDSEDLFDEAQRARVDSLRDYLDVAELTLADLPLDITNSFTSKDGEILNFVAINASVPLRHGKLAMDFAREIGEIRTPSGTYYASSAHIIFAEMLKVMRSDSKVAIGLTLVVVAVVLFIDLRSLVDTLLVLTPLLTALLWVTGFMYLFDMKLNLYNMVAFPTIIGMGVDNGVHIFHRYREAGAGSLRLVLRTTGIALLAASLTTMVGFSGLVPAHHPALSSIGILSLIGLACCFVTAVTLLPALLQMRERTS